MKFSVCVELYNILFILTYLAILQVLFFDTSSTTGANCHQAP